MADQPTIVTTPASGSTQDSATLVSPAQPAAVPADPSALAAQKPADTPLAAPEPKEKAAADDATAKMTERFTDLTAKNALLARGQRALSQEKKAFEEKQKSLQEKVTGYDEIQRLAKDDRVGLLRHLNLDYADVTTDVLKAPPEGEKKFISLQNEMQAFRDEKEADEKQRQADVSQERVAIYRDKLKKTIDSSGDYALLQTRGQEGIELVVQVVREHLKNHGELPTDEEALKAVETHLEQQVEAALATEKLKAKFQPAPEPEPEKPGEPTPEPGAEKVAAPPAIVSGVVVSRTSDKSGKTLTNRLQSIGSDQKKALLSNDESIAQAAAGLKWD